MALTWEFISKEEFAARLGKNKTTADVDRLHADGKIYAYPNPDLSRFNKAAEELVYPAWQIKMGKRNTIRPEIKKVRDAQALFVKNIVKEGGRVPWPDPTLKDWMLVSFFGASADAMTTKGRVLPHEPRMAEFIVAQDKSKNKRPITVAEFVKAWKYHEAPNL